MPGMLLAGVQPQVLGLVLYGHWQVSPAYEAGATRVGSQASGLACLLWWLGFDCFHQNSGFWDTP